MIDDEKEYIEFRLYLIGDYEVGKQSFINRLSKIPCTKTITIENEDNKSENYNNNTQLSNKVRESKLDNDNYSTSQKVNEESNEIINNHPFHNPSKLYNINHYKILFRPFYIIPAQDLPYDYILVEEEDSDFEIEKEYKILLKNSKKDLTQKIIIQDTVIPEHYLKGYKIGIENLLIFMFDLSNYSTFEKIICYYKSFEKAFHLNNEDNNNISNILIGNKMDIKINMNQEENETFHSFLSKTKMEYFECSTKPFFKFEKLIKDIFFNIYGNYREDFKSDYFINTFNLIISSKSNFSHSERTSFKSKNNNFPGPDYYNNNVFDLSNFKDIQKALIDKKLRFKNKIFVNKLGPILKKSRSVAKMKNDNYDRKQYKVNLKDMKECIDKPLKGFSLGIIPGKNNLRKIRTDLINGRLNILNNSFDDNITKINIVQDKKTHDENYFKEIEKRRNIYRNKLVNDMKSKRNNILLIHNINLDKLQKENLFQKESILLNKKLFHSNSSSNLLTSNPLDIERRLFDEKERQKQKERIYQVLYSKNQNHIQKQNEMKEKYIPEKISPSPNSYIINRDICQSNKGAIILGKRKELIKHILDPPFANIKTTFDKIVENISNEKISHSERFKDKEFDDRNTKDYKDKIIWDKWEKRKENSEKKLIIDNIKSEREYKKSLNQKNKEKNEETLKLKNDIIIRKQLNGKQYNDINYNLVEEQSPKYSIRGKEKEKNLNAENEKFLVIGGESDYLESKVKLNKPNFNYVKPKNPSFSFSKSERFIKEVYEYDNNILFPDLKFIPDEKENFLGVEPYSAMDQRIKPIYYNNFPGPGEYKIKSSFDEIVMKCKKKEKNEK